MRKNVRKRSGVMNLNVTSDSLIEEKEIVLKHLGIQLSKIRKNKNVTLEVMANKTFLSESYIRAIEKGLYACSIINFLKLCLALQVNPNVLLNELINNKTTDVIYKGDKDISKNIVEYLKKVD